MRRTCLAAAVTEGDSVKEHGGWWRKWALGIGAAGAVIIGGLFSCGAATESAEAAARPIKVSAQKSCAWRHKSRWRDHLDQRSSYTAGWVGCDAAVQASCLSIINVGSDYHAASAGGMYSCYSKAKVSMFRPTAYDYGSEFAFSLVLPAGYVWSKGFARGQSPNEGCQGARTLTLFCTNVHGSGIYLAGPARNE